MSEPGAAPTIDVPENGSYTMVAQACAMAIQDAIAYLRNTETISSAVIGVAQEMMLGTGTAEYERVIAAAQAAVVEAVKNVAAVGAATNTILQNFPHD